ncbi:MAG: hypothetical protein NC400_10225 [Clostridium sp.]|nr:hypothetical protein [Clostridium sp.]
MRQYSRTNAYQKNLQKSKLLAGKAYRDGKETPAYAQGKADGEALAEVTARNVIYSVADNVLAPALNGFVVWVLAQAMERGILRLYFLARDGYFMYQAACRYVEAFKLPIECRYLYCSRYSVRIPGYHLDTEKALTYITLGGLDVTVNTFYERAGFDEAQRKTLREAKILPYENEELVPHNELPYVKKSLSENKLFMELLIENSRKAWPVYARYLRQEGLMEEISAALVDSGWVGSMQKELNQSLQRLGRREQLSGFYWGLYEVPEGADIEHYHAYYFSPKGKIKRKVMFNNCLFETVFTAPHGMTLCYQREMEKVVPVLSDLPTERADRVILLGKLFLNWQELFLRQAAGNSFKKLTEEFCGKQTCHAIVRNLELFMHHPTKEEAYTFGKMDFSDDILESMGKQIAAELTERELAKNHLLSRLTGELILGRTHVRQSAWYEGSATAYGKYPVYHIAQYTGYKYLLYYRKEKRLRRREHGNETGEK